MAADAPRVVRRCGAWALAAVLVLAAALLAPPRLSAQGEDICPEPNAAPQSSCSIGPDSDTLGFLSSGDDVDTYAIETVHFNVQLHAELAQAPGTYRLHLWDGRGDAVGPLDAGGPVLDLTLSEPGRYYIVVDSPSGQVAAGEPYRLGVTFDRAAPGRAVPVGSLDHAPDGATIDYGTRPPTSGVHYGAWYPSYGVVEQPVPPGNWVHNLEHGAVVLLYNCPAGCPDLVAQLQQLYAGLPPGRDPRRPAARLLVVPYADIDHRIAVVSWGRLLELDEFDAVSILRFFEAYVDRGPECRNLACPP